MTQTIHCPHCSVELTIPDGAGTKRLRCPKCASRFYPAASSDAVPRRPASSILAEEIKPPASPRPRRSSPSSGLHQVPRKPPASSIPARDDGTIPLESLDDLPPSSRSTPILSDVEALFRDDEVSPRKKSPAEARREARRCPSCGAFVLGGMSLCERCGLDLDSGMRHQLDEIIEETPPPMEVAGPPASVFMIGIITIFASIVLGMLSLISFTGLGRVCLTITCGFGVFASIQFLQGRSWQLLVVALLLGGAVDVITMIVLPIAIVDLAMPAPAGLVEPLDETAVPEIGVTSDLAVDVPLREEKINTSKVILGVVILFADAFLLVWISTPPVVGYFKRTRVDRDTGYVTI